MGFNESMAFVFKHEGVLSDVKEDAGGLTKYGISSKAYPGLDIRNLTIDQARAIYRRDYWDKNHCEQLPASLAHLVFDFGVNSGVSVGAKALQASLNDCGYGPLKVDGDFGPKTLAAAASCDPRKVALDMLLDRREFYQGIVQRKPDQKKFLKGWLNRVNDDEVFEHELFKAA